MKALIIAILIALPTMVHAQTLVKLWAVGSIIVMEYLEDNGDRTVYAYSKSDSSDYSFNDEDEHNATGFHPGPRPYDQITQEIARNSYVIRAVEFPTHENISTALNVLMTSPAWENGENVFDIESDAIRLLRDAAGMMDGSYSHFTQWLDFLFSQPYANRGKSIDVRIFVEYLMKKATVDELHLGAGFIKGLFRKIDNDTEKLRIAQSLSQLNTYIEAISE